METADPLWKYKLNKRNPVGTILAPIFSDPSTISTTRHSKGNRSNRLLQGNETGRVGGTDTGTTVLDGLVRDRELSQVVANHLRLDLNLVELLSGVDTDDGADHLGDNDHVTEVGLDEVGLLVGLGLLLGLAELLDETHGLALQTAVEASAGTGVDDITELLGGKVEELVEVNAAVRELAELSSLLDLGSLLGVVFNVSHFCGVSLELAFRVPFGKRP
jgi:hypothetical protein